MTPHPLVRAAALAALALTAAPQASQDQMPSLDLVEIDAVVTDKQGRAVTTLTREDFEVKEDGRAVQLTTFLAVSAAGSTTLDDGRSIVVLLDDVGMGAVATSAMKSVAEYVVYHAGPGDDLSVIRFANRSDEPYGDEFSAWSRISDFRAGVSSYDPLTAAQDALKLVASVSRRFDDGGRRRKIIVCIGSRRICNVQEPGRYAPGSLWKDWVDAVSEAARANMSVYALTNRRGPMGRGLVEATGGQIFASATDLRPAIERIWQDASQHYLLGYWPDGSSKELHSISVKVAGKGLRVHARRVRGR